MQAPLEPLDEQLRMDELRRLRLLDTPSEERFDRITRIAARLFDVPIALVTLVDERRQWFKSAQGLAAPQTSREVSFCGHAILDDAVFVVPDALHDERFADNPLVTGDPDIRFYAGAPLHGPSGRRVGTLCIIDREPRMFSSEDTETLKDLALLVESEFDRQQMGRAQEQLLEELSAAEQRASIDALTRLWNRDFMLRLLERQRGLAIDETKPLPLALLDVDHFKKVNDTWGHVAGDEVLSGVAARMRRALRPADAVGRYGGEEFLIVLAPCSEAEAAAVLNRLRASIAEAPIETSAGAIRVTVSIGLAHAERPGALSATDQIREADGALYAAKAAGRNTVRAAPQDSVPPARGARAGPAA